MIVLTTYFNPGRSKRRLENYRVFRSLLKVPLLTIELAFDRRFELGAGDADHLVQLTGGDVMWQKERLLNIALRSIPAGVEDVAWVDCDVVFTKPDWADAVRSALKQNRLVHLFSDIVYLERSDDPEDPEVFARRSPVPGTIRFIQENSRDLTTSPPAGQDGRVLHCPGMGFAIKRHLIEDFGFYDVCVVGGGNYLEICSYLGRFEIPPKRIGMNDRWRPHYLKWAEKAHRAVDGKIGFISGRIGHLWHGELEHRRYADRHRILADFDPVRDLIRAESGVWAWTDPGSQLAKNVRHYFDGRREDG